jgi:hypothetical protein
VRGTEGAEPEGLLFVGVFSEAVCHSSEDEALSSALTYAAAAVVPGDLAARNLLDRGRDLGVARTSELLPAALAPVGISTIWLSLDGVRGVAKERVGPLLELEELGVPPTAGGLPAWLSPSKLALSGPRYDKRGSTGNLGVIGLGLALAILGAGED